MYQSHWGLRESPFRSCLDPQFFYQAATQEEGLARLHFLVDQRRRLGLLMGPGGSGKSLLLEVFARELRREGRPVARLSAAGVEPAELLAAIATELGLAVDCSDNPAVLWRSVTDRVLEYRYQQQDTAILLDDADLAGRQSLVQIARLAHFDPSPEARLTMVLSGRRERMGRLGEPLLDLADLRIDIEPWQPEETRTFLDTVLTRAGGPPEVFAEPAASRLHELSHGIPRRVRQLADLALLAGAGRDLRQIDVDVVESVYHELGVVEV
ncbi:MAG: AAA family ATPase [Thermoguttaceae bacterium]|jgi:type II secretory pathway predicted ATPase ExeA